MRFKARGGFEAPEFRNYMYFELEVYPVELTHGIAQIASRRVDMYPVNTHRVRRSPDLLYFCLILVRTKIIWIYCYYGAKVYEVLEHYPLKEVI